MLQRLWWRFGVTLLLAALAATAFAQDVSRIRLMLHPYAAPPGALPPAALAKLQALAGVPLTYAATTRTGGLEFTNATVNREPKWRHARPELTTGYRRTSY